MRARLAVALAASRVALALPACFSSATECIATDTCAPVTTSDGGGGQEGGEAGEGGKGGEAGESGEGGDGGEGGVHDGASERA